MKPHERHRAEAVGRLKFELITVSTSRYSKMREKKPHTDEGGDVAQHEIEKAGHLLSNRSLIPDDRSMIQGKVRRFLSGQSDVLVLTGGTGIAKGDLTIESVRPLFERELDGFGELVRRVGFDEVGSAAMLTRATAGVTKGRLIVCLPGSPNAVRSALRTTLPEFPHIVYIARS